MQADDSRQHQLLWEENQGLKEELKRLDAKARHASTYLQDGWEKDRRENISLRLELDELRSSATATSSDQISIQLWQDHALDAGRRAEEAEHRAEEAEHRAEEAEHRAEEAERELSRLQGSLPEFDNIWRAMGQTLANAKGRVVDDSVDAIFLPGDEYEVSYQGQSITQTSKGEEMDDQGQQGSQASQHEEADEQGQSTAQASVGEEIDDQGQQGSQASQHEEADEQGQYIAQVSEAEEIDDHGQQSDQADDGEEIDYQDQQSDQASLGQESYYMGQETDQTIEGENALHAFEPETISNPEDDSQYESSQIRVSIPRMPDSGSAHKLSIRGLEGAQRQPLSPSPPPFSSPSQPQQSHSVLPSMGETTNPSDQPSANDTGNRPDITNSLDNLGDMERALPTLSINSKQKEQDFPVLLKGSSQIPGIPTVSTAPPIPKRPTPIPIVELGGWDLHGDVVERRPAPSEVYKGWPPMAPLRSKPGVIDSVAAEKQPERPSPAKEASSATGGDPPKPIGTKSYAGTAQAPPPEVQETAQSSRTILKSGNAAAKAVAQQTDASPADQADNTSGFQTVTSRRGRGHSDRGRGSLGRGEAGSNKGGHQQGKFGQFQYHGRGGQGGNQKGGNQGASQGQART